MVSISDLPKAIPVFPLSGVVLLPRTKLSLHIFEPRYLAMIEDCLKSKPRIIGMIQPREAPGREDGFQNIGCAGRLISFCETADGHYMITLSGVSRFRLGERLSNDTPYLSYFVNWDSFTLGDMAGAAQLVPKFNRQKISMLVKRYLAKNGLRTDQENLEMAAPEVLINALSMFIPFSPEDKQALLEAPALSDRYETLITLMEFSLHGGSSEDTAQ